jgi:hypothetical protein
MDGGDAASTDAGDAEAVDSAVDGSDASSSDGGDAGNGTDAADSGG